MKAVKKGVFAGLLLLCGMLMQLPAVANANPVVPYEKRMAFNIYSNPNLKHLNAFDTFTIDFQANETPYCTYWALCNWHMETSGSQQKYPGIQGDMGAYGGLQNTVEPDPRKAIMSFWEVNYGNGEKLRANRMYPSGEDVGFGGEGEGNKWLTHYDWKNGQWYRMAFHSWEDKNTGTTFIGQWAQDIKSGKWTLISYFDTHLTNSYMTGALSQFMEDYVHTTAEEERDFKYKNMYVQAHGSTDWTSLDTTTLSYDKGNSEVNKRGPHSFGSESDYFWGKSGGILPQGMTQEEYNTQSGPSSASYTIDQPDKPNLGVAKVDGIKLSETENGWQVKWNVPENANPQLAYEIKLYDANGNLIGSQSATRPEVREANFASVNARPARCEVSVTDIFGTSAQAETQEAMGLSTVELSAESLSLVAGGEGKTVEVSGKGAGDLYVFSDDDNVATATVTGSTITVKPVGEGTCNVLIMRWATDTSDYAYGILNVTVAAS